MHNTQILRIADFDQIFYSNFYVPTSRQCKKNIKFPADFLSSRTCIFDFIRINCKIPCDKMYPYSCT